MTDNPNKITEAKPAEDKPYRLLGFYAMASDGERQEMIRHAKRRLLENMANNNNYPNPKEI